jgi:hypothetical protein
MNNEQAANSIDTIFVAAQTVFQAFTRYKRESANWNADYIAAQIAEVKTLATAAGIDLSAWTGAD